MKRNYKQEQGKNKMEKYERRRKIKNRKWKSKGYIIS